MSDNEHLVPVPPRTANEITEARDHLRNASHELAVAARQLKVYSHDSSVLALHIERQVGELTDQVDDLLAGLEVVR